MSCPLVTDLRTSSTLSHKPLPDKSMNSKGKWTANVLEKHPDARSPLVDMVNSEDATSGWNSQAEQIQSHMVDPDEVETFEFLSGLDKSYSSRTRAHVLKKHQRQRREEARQRKSV